MRARRPFAGTFVMSRPCTASALCLHRRAGASNTLEGKTTVPQPTTDPRDAADLSRKLKEVQARTRHGDLRQGNPRQGNPRQGNPH